MTKEFKNTRVVVADFDGVLVRKSEFFKRDAWPHVFEPVYGDRYKPHFEMANREYERSKKGDRFSILRSTYRGLGEPEEKLDELVARGAQTFDEIVQRSILAAGADPTVVAALEEISKKIPVYLNSATPIEPLAHTVAALRIGYLFKGVLGRPNSKAENFALVADREHVKPAEMLFIGDSQSDADAAAEFGCRFHGWANEWNEWKQDSKPFPVIADMMKLCRLVL